MKKIKLGIASLSLLHIPLIASASLTDDAGGLGGVQTFIETVLEFSQETLVPFVLGIGFLAFVWGMFRFFIAGGANEESRESGKNLMIYATLGFVFIIIFWGVINLLATSIGLEGEDGSALIDTVKPIEKRAAGA